MPSLLIKAVVLDLGEVLIRLNFSEIMKLRGLVLDPTRSALGESLNHMDQWGLYDSFERGLVSEQEFVAGVSRSLGYELPLPKFLTLWNSVLKESVPGVAELVQHLVSKLPLYALTNSNETHIRHAKANYPWLRKFNHLYTSFELQARKPERVIYERLAQKINTLPEHILFIDDRLENVEGARRAGWFAEQCRSSPKDLIEILIQYGLFINQNDLKI